MGVSGAGKSEVGRRLAQALDQPFLEGDTFHSASSVAKMALGTPLTDDDRQEWLTKLSHKIQSAQEAGQSLVLSCSSLKRKYRDLLRTGDPALVFVYLNGERALIADRMQSRANHFMPTSLLDSQFRDLEPPGPDERVIELDIRMPLDDLADQILQKFAAL
jgi:gluconokinase